MGVGSGSDIFQQGKGSLSRFPDSTERMADCMAGDINIVAIVKGEERYVFMFDDDSRAEALRTLGRYASNPELSFSWYDAAVLSQKIRKIAAPQKKPALNPMHFDHPVRQRGCSRPAPGKSGSGGSLFPDFDSWAGDDPCVGDEPAP